MKEINKIGLGTVQFGLDYGISNTCGQPVANEVLNILKDAQKRKITLIDTAAAYGNAEETLGAFDLSGFKVVSKFLPPSRVGKRISEQLSDSLKKLRLDALYGYLAHRPMDVYENRRQWEELLKLKEEGKIQRIGFSLNEPVELEKLLSINNIFPDLIQAPYNYFDHRFKDQMIALKDSGCEIHTRSTFLQGLFFMNTECLDPYFDEAKPFLKDIQNHSFLAGSLLRYVVEKPFIDRVIMGVQNQKQLEQNFEELKAAPLLQEFDERISDKILLPFRWPKP